MSHFDWDPAKADANLRLHGVSFDEAESAAVDSLAKTLPDADHSGTERRFRTIAYSDQGRLLVVITSEGGPRPRIISARRATKRERHAYQERRR